jgi:hypothetical protein
MKTEIKGLHDEDDAAQPAAKAEIAAAPAEPGGTERTGAEHTTSG